MGAVPQLHDPSRACELAELARLSLIAEADLTPKPGLVDRRGSGSHSDLSLDLMRRSAIVLEPFFAAMALASGGRIADRELRGELASIGRDAERAMFQATMGANSHKGAIWILGLLVAGAAQKNGRTAREIAEAAARIARFPDRASPRVVTHGEIVRSRFGADGARGEAMRAFPHVVKLGLPMLRRQRVLGYTDDVCRLDALFAIMSRLDDTCVLYRGGPDALTTAKAGARAVIAAGGYGTARGQAEARRLDGELSARRISPGGAADLLAATIFLDLVEAKRMGGNQWRSLSSITPRRVGR
jgi:triphosphoribosyl-dephospho-CoA synthase